MHANFIVNHGDACATDVQALIALARQTVLEQAGISLELEIQLVGDWELAAQESRPPVRAGRQQVVGG